jgi:hypothetical protein
MRDPTAREGGGRELRQVGDVHRTPAIGRSRNGRAESDQHAIDGGRLRARKALWVAVVVVPAILGALLLANAGGQGIPVLAAAHALSTGSVVRASDLVTVQITARGSHVATMPASERSLVIGKTATGPLSPGQLLSPSSISSGPQLGPNEVGLALALSPDQAAQGILAVGQSVLIVSGQSQGGSGQGLSVPARVLGILSTAAGSSQVVVDLAIDMPAQVGAVSAAAASTTGVRLVVLPGSGNG